MGDRDSAGSLTHKVGAPRRASLGVASAWRAACAGLLACVTLLGLVACGEPASGERTITLWAMGREGEVVAELLPEFERAHPGVHVKVQQLPWTAAHEKLLTAFAGGAMPDLAQMGNTWLPEMSALHALEPLDRWIAGSSVVQPSDYFKGIWDTNVVDGATTGVPWYVDTRLLFYRRDILAQAGFDAPPRDWDEWRRMLRTLQAQRGPDRHGVLLPLNEFEPLLALALQQEEPLLRDEGRYGNFRGAGFRRALGFYDEMFREGWAPGLTNNQISNVWNEIGRGRYVFYISGPWNIGEFKRRLPPESQGGWMTAPLPGPHGPGASIAGGSSLVMFRTARHKAEAWQLIEYLSSPEVQRRFHALTGDLPPRRSTWAHPALEGDVYARAFREQLERVKPAPPVPEWERIVTEMQLVAARTVSLHTSLEAATAELDQRVDAMLEKRRWMLERRAKVQP